MSVAGVLHFGDPAHGAFEAWLAGGAQGDLEPEIAGHAMACDACRNAIAAIDALRAMDTARSDLPAVAAASHVDPGWHLLRHVVPASAVLVLALAQVAGSGRVLAPGAISGDGGPDLWQATFGAAGVAAPWFLSPPASPGDSTQGPGPSPSLEQQTQPGQGFPPIIPLPGASATPFTPSGVPGATPGPSSPGTTSNPTASATPNRTPPPTPTPPPPTPEPTAPPTPQPTPEPTPQATASPVLPQCSDGIDNDGDGLIDFGPAVPPLGTNDPGCLSPDDNSELLL